MKSKETTTCMANGSTTYWDRDEETGRIPWNQHHKFEGVYVKHLIKGTDTQGMLSCHLARLDPNAILED